MNTEQFSFCPRCAKAHEAQRKDATTKTKNAYGHVLPDEYGALKDALQHHAELTPTLREYYEIGVNRNGEFVVRYRSFCEVCEFEFSYNFKKATNA